MLFHQCDCRALGDSGYSCKGLLLVNAIPTAPCPGLNSEDLILVLCLVLGLP